MNINLICFHFPFSFRKLMTFLFLLWFIPTALAIVRIPLYNNHMNVTITDDYPGLHRSSAVVEVRITPLGHSVIAIDGMFPRHSISAHWFSFGRLQFQDIHAEFGAMRSTFGIGPGSTFLSSMRAVYKIGNELVVRNSRGDDSVFWASCVEGSNFTLSSWRDVTVTGHVTLSGGASVSHQRDEIHLYDSRDYISISRLFAERLVDIVRGFGGITHGYWAPISNCTQETLAALPSIQFHMGTGRLDIFPNEYIEHNITSDVCRFTFGVGFVKINLFDVPNINVRLTASSIEVCDAASSS